MAKWDIFKPQYKRKSILLSKSGQRMIGWAGLAFWALHLKYRTEPWGAEECVYGKKFRVWDVGEGGSEYNV
jgi:hypothetical protein